MIIQVGNFDMSSPKRPKKRRPGTRLPTTNLTKPRAMPQTVKDSPQAEIKRARTENLPIDPKAVTRPTYRMDLAKRCLEVKCQLGSGSYSKVKLACNTASTMGELVAVKIVDREKAPKDYLEHFLPRELHIWARLRHPNLVQLFDYFEVNNRMYMVLEFLNEGDALTYIQKNGMISEKVAKSWMLQIIEAVKYMHDRNVAHRDLKLENLLLTDHCMTVKLCDFGFVKEVGVNEDLSQTFCGSKAYAAPEILKGQAYDPKKGDVWALGVIMYILVTGKMPFDESKGSKRIVEDQKSLRLQWNKTVRISPRCHQLIIQMLTWDFSERPAISKILQDEWLLPATANSLGDYHTPHNELNL